VNWAAGWKVIGDGVIAHLDRGIVLLDVDHLLCLWGDQLHLTDEEIERYALSCWTRYARDDAPNPTLYVHEDRWIPTEEVEIVAN